MTDDLVHPVVTWDIGHVDNTIGCLTLLTAHSDAHKRGIGDGTRLPDSFRAMLTPAQCIALGRDLTVLGFALLGQNTPDKSGQH